MVQGVLANGTIFVALGADTRRWHDQLEEQLSELGPGRPRLVVDLTATDALDSGGVGALVLALKVAERRGGEIALGCTPAVRDRLRLVGLHRFFTLRDGSRV